MSSGASACSRSQTPAEGARAPWRPERGGAHEPLGVPRRRPCRRPRGAPARARGRRGGRAASPAAARRAGRSATSSADGAVDTAAGSTITDSGRPCRSARANSSSRRARNAASPGQGGWPARASEPAPRARGTAAMIPHSQKGRSACGPRPRERARPPHRHPSGRRLSGYRTRDGLSVLDRSPIGDVLAVFVLIVLAGIVTLRRRRHMWDDDPGAPEGGPPPGQPRWPGRARRWPGAAPAAGAAPGPGVGGGAAAAVAEPALLARKLAADLPSAGAAIGRRSPEPGATFLRGIPDIRRFFRGERDPGLLRLGDGVQPPRDGPLGSELPLRQLLRQLRRRAPGVFVPREWSPRRSSRSRRSATTSSGTRR